MTTAGYDEPPAPSFLFDLDGTLIDSVYLNVIAWRAALAKLGIGYGREELERAAPTGSTPIPVSCEPVLMRSASGT